MVIHPLISEQQCFNEGDLLISNPKTCVVYDNYSPPNSVNNSEYNYSLTFTKTPVHN